MNAPARPATPAPASGLTPLREFVTGLARVLALQPTEADILAQGRVLLARLVARDDWLPDEYAEPHPVHYRQYLLHADSAERFSVVSFVWGPGQHTPIHDHTVWGLIGVLRGAETAQRYRIGPAGVPIAEDAPVRLTPGAVEAVSPRIGDVHRVANALGDGVSISIHVYGANIGAVQRSVYAEDGLRKPFVSGYSNTRLPNLWNLPESGPRP